LEGRKPVVSLCNKSHNKNEGPAGAGTMVRTQGTAGHSLAATPLTADVLTPKTSPTRKRTGKQLWKTAQRKMHAYHDVVHQLQHRAQEKAAFGLAEAALTRVGAYAASRVQSTVATVKPATVKTWWRGVRRLIGKLKTTVGKLRPRKTAAAAATAPLAHHHVAHHHAAHRGILGHGLHAVHVALPLVGTYLIAHLAHHDLHRARHEWHATRTVVPTALFYLGTLCDIFDALAHALIVLCLVLPENGVLNHHVEHDLHTYSMFAALIACVSMMLGEAICARRDRHGDSHGHGHGHRRAGQAKSIKAE